MRFIVQWECKWKLMQYRFFLFSDNPSSLSRNWCFFFCDIWSFLDWLREQFFAVKCRRVLRCIRASQKSPLLFTDLEFFFFHIVVKWFMKNGSTCLRRLMIRGFNTKLLVQTKLRGGMREKLTSSECLKDVGKVQINGRRQLKSLFLTFSTQVMGFFSAAASPSWNNFIFSTTYGLLSV